MCDGTRPQKCFQIKQRNSVKTTFNGFLTSTSGNIQSLTKLTRFLPSGKLGYASSDSFKYWALLNTQSYLKYTNVYLYLNHADSNLHFGP